MRRVRGKYAAPQDPRLRLAPRARLAARGGRKNELVKDFQ